MGALREDSHTVTNWTARAVHWQSRSQKAAESKNCTARQPERSARPSGDDGLMYDIVEGEAPVVEPTTGEPWTPCCCSPRQRGRPRQFNSRSCVFRSSESLRALHVLSVLRKGRGELGDFQPAGLRPVR